MKLFKNLSFNDIAGLLIVLVFVGLLIALVVSNEQQAAKTMYTYYNGVRI